MRDAAEAGDEPRPHGTPDPHAEEPLSYDTLDEVAAAHEREASDDMIVSWAPEDAAPGATNKQNLPVPPAEPPSGDTLLPEIEPIEGPPEGSEAPSLPTLILRSSDAIPEVEPVEEPAAAASPPPLPPEVLRSKDGADEDEPDARSLPSMLLRSTDAAPVEVVPLDEAAAAADLKTPGMPKPLRIQPPPRPREEVGAITVMPIGEEENASAVEVSRRVTPPPIPTAPAGVAATTPPPIPAAHAETGTAPPPVPAPPAEVPSSRLAEGEPAYRGTGPEVEDLDSAIARTLRISADEMFAASAPRRSMLDISGRDGGGAPILVLRPGDRFGRFEIIKQLGRGGMGVVYKAWQPELKRFVALKTLATGGESHSDDVARFKREAQAAAKLRHPNIVAIHDVDREADIHYFTMDCIDGRSLEDLFRTRSLQPALDETDLERFIRLMKKVCDAVAEANRQGIIHRDLKPSNILVDRKGEPYVADFGLAKVAEARTRLTLSGVLLGTPCYMAPEQAQGSWDAVDARTDVYGLGVVLYEGLVGDVPFTGKTPGDVLFNVVNETPVPPRKANPRVPPELHAVCLKAIEKDPRFRYRDTAELGADLQRYLSGQPVDAAAEQAWLYRARKQVMRHPLITAASLAVAVTLGWFGQKVWEARQDTSKTAQRRVEDTFKARFAGAIQALQKNEIAAAKAALEQLRDEKPDVGDIHYYLGRAFVASNETDQALAEFTLAVQRGVQLPDLFRERGRILLSLGRTTDAISDFDNVLTVEPNDIETRLKRATLYRGLAIENPAASREFSDRALADLQILDRQAGTPEVWESLATLLESKGSIEAAASYYQRVLAAKPTPGAACALGRLAEARGASLDAAEFYRRALSFQADHVPALSAYARILCDFGEAAKARRVAETALDKDADNVEALLVAGSVDRDTGNLERAKERCSRAVELDGRSVPALLALARTLAASGSGSAAMQMYGRVLGVLPDDPLALYERGAVAAHLGQDSQARADWDKAFQQQPEWKRDFAGGFYGRPEKYEHEIVMVSAELSEKPNDGDLLLRRGRYFRWAGRDDEAIADLSRAIPLLKGPAAGQAGFEQGLAFAHDGHAELAIPALVAAYQADPELDYVPYVARYLATLHPMSSRTEELIIQMGDNGTIRRIIESGISVDLPPLPTPESAAAHTLKATLTFNPESTASVQQAIASLSRAIAIDPTSIQPLLARALAYGRGAGNRTPDFPPPEEASDDPAQAKEKALAGDIVVNVQASLARAIALSPFNSTPHVWAAWLLKHRDMSRMILPLGEEFTRWSSRSNLFRALNDDCRKELKAAFDLGDERVAYMLAIDAATRGEHEEAAKYFGQMGRVPQISFATESSVNMLAPAWTTSVDRTTVEVVRAIAEIDAGKPREALDRLARLVNSESSGINSPTSRSSHLLALADACDGLNEGEITIDLAWGIGALALKAMGKPDSAIDNLGIAESMTPGGQAASVPLYRLEHVHLLLEKGDVPAARGIVELMEESPQRNAAQAWVLLREGDADGAWAALKRFVGDSESDIDYFRTRHSPGQDKPEATPGHVILDQWVGDRRMYEFVRALEKASGKKVDEVLGK